MDNTLGLIRTRRRTPMLALALWAAGVIFIALAGTLGYLQHKSGTPALGTPKAEGRAGSIDGTSMSGSATSSKAAASASASGALVAKRTPPSIATAAAPVLRWPLWEFQVRQPIPPRDPPLTPPTWRLVGATGSAGNWKLIIVRQGKTAPEFYSTGDSLPGGYVVGKITEEDVTLIQGKRAILLSYIGI